jgi:hypothetical protein
MNLIKLILTVCIVILLSSVVRFIWNHKSVVIEVKYERNSGPDFIVKKSSFYLDKLKLGHPETNFTQIISLESLDSREIMFSKSRCYIQGKYITSEKADGDILYPVFKIEQLKEPVFYWGNLVFKILLFIILLFLFKRVSSRIIRIED